MCIIYLIVIKKFKKIGSLRKCGNSVSWTFIIFYNTFFCSFNCWATIKKRSRMKWIYLKKNIFEWAFVLCFVIFIYLFFFGWTTGVEDTASSFGFDNLVHMLIKLLIDVVYQMNSQKEIEWDKQVSEWKWMRKGIRVWKKGTF